MEQIISEYYARDIGMEEVMESYVIILFTELQNEQKKKGVWQNDRHCACKTGIRKISG